MVKHIVLVKGNEQLTIEKKKELIEQFKQLERIPGVLNLEVGESFSKLSKKYEIGLSINFLNESTLKDYSKHPMHLDVVKFLQSLEIEYDVVDYLIVQ